MSCWAEATVELLTLIAFGIDTTVLKSAHLNMPDNFHWVHQMRLGKLRLNPDTL